MGWWAAIAFVASFVVSYVAIGRNSTQPTVKPGQIENPQVKLGRSIPIVRGRARVKSPQIGLILDKDSVALKKKGGKK
jgi:hypothetical protein